MKSKVTATKISCDGVSDKKGGDIIDCAFDPKGTSLACCVGNQSILVLTNTSAKQIGISEWERTILNGPNHTTILLIDWDFNGNLLAAGDFNGRVYVFSVESGNIVLSGKAADRITSIKFNHRGAPQYLLTATDNGSVLLWNCTDGGKQTYNPHSSSVRAVEWLSSTTFASCSLDSTIQVFQIDQMEAIQSFYHEAAVLSIRYNPLEDGIAFFSYNTTVQVWSLANDNCRRWTEHTGAVYSVDWSGDQSNLLASGSDDRTVLVRDLKSDSSTQLLKGHADFVAAISFSPNSQYLASADGDGTVIIWSTESWESVFHCHCSGPVLDVASLKWNSQSDRLVVANQSKEMEVIELDSSN